MSAAAAVSASPVSSERSIGPVRVAATTSDAAVRTILDAIDSGRPALFAFANAHSVNLARRRPSFVAALSTMTVFNDGIGVELASRLMYGAGFPSNLNGTDLTPALLERLRSPTPVFLLGGAPGIAERAGTALASRFPQCRIVGVHDGFFAEHQEPAVAERIIMSGARLVLVGMGQPRQEMWAERWGGGIPAATCCIGAFLDFAAGAIPRAPGWVRAARLEWAFRLALEPRRLAKRYLIGNVDFIAAAAMTALRHRWRGRSRSDPGLPPAGDQPL